MENTRLPSMLNIIAGIWLIIAPFILGYANIAGALWSDIIVGAAVIIFALVRSTGDPHTTWASWANLVLGIWLIIAPFAIGYSAISAALWNVIILGIAVVVFALWSGGSTVTTEDRFTQPT